jgi:hypothetical protein
MDIERRRFLERSTALALGGAVGGTSGCAGGNADGLRSDTGRNLLIAAEAGGWRGDYRVIARQPTDPVVLEVEWTRVPPRTYPLSRLTQRRTLRSGFENRVLSDADLAFLSAGVADCRYVLAGSPAADYIADGTVAAMRAQSLRDSAQQELGEWIRWSPEAQRQHRDGLTPAQSWGERCIDRAVGATAEKHTAAESSDYWALPPLPPLARSSIYL